MAHQISIEVIYADGGYFDADVHCLKGLEDILDDVRDDSLVKCARGYAHDGEDVQDGTQTCCRCSHVHDFDAPCPESGTSCGRIDCCQP